MNKNIKSSVKMSKLAITITLFLVVGMIVQASYISLAPKVFGVDLKELSTSRNTKKYTIEAMRGEIFDTKDSAIAQNMASYTVIAYLDEERSKDREEVLHVIDLEMTAEALEPVLAMEKETILNLLQKDLYQVELGPGGRGITELKKEEIEKLKLSGIDFIPAYKRYYPNGYFSSYNIGYAKNQEDGKIVGELGLESYYNDVLSGTDGYLEFESDRLGYKIPGTNEIREAAEDGSDMYLTIDSNIQYFVENALSDTFEAYNPEWIVMTVVDAKTGAILASSSYPSFDPNILNIDQYLNPLVSFTYEPGSTMKTFSYMSAIENNVYDGSETFSSKEYKVGPDTINNWDDRNFGTIDYDKGYVLSSNVAVANLIDKKMNKDMLMDFYKDLGFGEKTKINLPMEEPGVINFKYPIEVVTAGYGQGISVTPIQMVKALTAITNEGEVLNPYLVKKIVSSTTGEITYQGERSVYKKVAEKATVDQIKELMERVIYDEESIAKGYMVEDYNLIGKTGTAEIVSKSGGYLSGGYQYVYSFSGIFPKENPEIIIYGAMRKPTWGGNGGLAVATVEVVENIGNYLNLGGSSLENEKINFYKMPSLINKGVAIAENMMYDLDTKFIILGSGNKIIDQIPQIDSSISSKEIVVAITNSHDFQMPDITYWSFREIVRFANLINLELKTEGYGFVKSQSISPGTMISTDDILTVILEPYCPIEEPE